MKNYASAVAFGLVTLLAASIGLQAQAAETRRDNYGDWGLVCSKADEEGAQENSKESCNLFQVATLSQNQGEETAETAQPQRVLLTRIGYLPENDNPVMFVTTPLGILLQPGVRVDVEGHEPIGIPLQRCDAGGCLAYVVLENPFIEAMKKGIEAKVTFMDPQRRPITLPLSLKGITKALSELDATRQ